MGYSEPKKDELPASLFGALALHQHRLNQAVGIRRVTPQVDLLLVNYQLARQREVESFKSSLSGLALKHFYLGVIREARQRIKQIKAKITPNTPIEEAQKLYREAMQLQQQIDKANEAMNG